MNIRKICAGMLALLAATASTAAADNHALLQGDRLAFSRLITNDQIGDGEDRWQTFSYGISALKPLEDGAVGELRLRTGVIAGDRLKLRPEQEPDRRMAGVLGLGAYRSDRIGDFDYRIGVELTAVGPQTGMVKFQDRLHRLINQGGPSARAQELQIPDRIFLGLSGEVGRDFAVGQTAIRPWVAAGGGPEPLARVGIDLIWGPAAGNFGVRDELTGWRIPVLQDRSAYGRSFIAGFDIAHLAKSAYIAKENLVQNRFRVRAGGLLEFGGGRIFYGATYLSEEFKAQPEAQVLGSITFTMHF